MTTPTYNLIHRYLSASLMFIASGVYFLFVLINSKEATVECWGVLGLLKCFGKKCDTIYIYYIRDCSFVLPYHICLLVKPTSSNN